MSKKPTLRERLRRAAKLAGKQDKRGCQGCRDKMLRKMKAKEAAGPEARR